MRALVSCPPTIVGRCTHRVQKMEVNAGKKVRQRKWFQNKSNSIVHPIRNASFYIFLIHRFIIVHFSTPCILNLDNVSFFQIITIVHNLKKNKVRSTAGIDNCDLQVDTASSSIYSGRTTIFNPSATTTDDGDWRMKIELLYCSCCTWWIITICRIRNPQ